MYDLFDTVSCADDFPRYRKLHWSQPWPGIIPSPHTLVILLISSKARMSALVNFKFRHILWFLCGMFLSLGFACLAIVKSWLDWKSDPCRQNCVAFYVFLRHTRKAWGACFGFEVRCKVSAKVLFNFMCVSGLVYPIFTRRLWVAGKAERWSHHLQPSSVTRNWHLRGERDCVKLPFCLTVLKTFNSSFWPKARRKNISMLITHHPAASNGNWGGLPFQSSCPPTLLRIKARQDFDTPKVLKAKRKQVEEKFKPNLAPFKTSIEWNKYCFYLPS